MGDSGRDSTGVDAVMRRGRACAWRRAMRGGKDRARERGAVWRRGDACTGRGARNAMMQGCVGGGGQGEKKGWKRWDGET